MDSEDTPEDAEFRAETAAWLKENGVPKLSDQSMAIRRSCRARKCNTKKFEGGFVGIWLPKKYGGRGRLAASADHLQTRRTQLCGTAEYLQHQRCYGGAGADDLCDGRAKAGTGSVSPERGQHLVLVFLGAGGGFGPRRAAYGVGERRRRLGD